MNVGALSLGALILWSLGTVVLVLGLAFLARLSRVRTAAAALDGLDEAVLVLDQKDCILWASLEASRLLGPSLEGRYLSEFVVDSEDRLLSARDPQPGNDGDAGDCLSRVVPTTVPMIGLRGEIAVHPIWGFVPWKGGQQRSLLLRDMRPWLSRAGHQLTSATDQLEERLAEETRARRLAQVANDAKSAFLASMSREIRTPINGILGMVQLLFESELDAEQADSLGIVRTSSEALLTIVNDILDVSKIDAGKLDIEPIEFDLKVAVSEVAELMAVKCAESELELILHFLEDAPRGVIGDPGRLRQVVANLVGSAIKFTESGQVVVEVFDRCSDERMARFRVEVRGTGIGIEESALATLFDDFTQAGPSTSRIYGGTGLGLAISKRLVELMDGVIGVESSPGLGTTFWFELEFPRAELSRLSFESEAALVGRRVLVVDDSEIDRRVVSDALERRGLTVVCAESGEQGLATWGGPEVPFDFVILDQEMPGMSGMSLAARICASEVDRERPRLILLTSTGFRGDARRAADSGIDSYLPKPVELRSLYEALLALAASPEGAPSLVTRHALRETHEARAEAYSNGDARPCRVLLVEDNPTNQKVAQGMLKRLNCEVCIAENGREGVDRAFSEPFDLILMDCQMPVLDGLTATGEVRGRERADEHRLIVAMTANAMSGDRERCLEAGTDDYLSKPVTLGALRQIFETWRLGPFSSEGQSRDDLQPGVSA